MNCPVVSLCPKSGFKLKVYELLPTKNNADAYKDAIIELGEAIRMYNIKQWVAFVNGLGPHPLSTIPFWRRINRLRSGSQAKNVSDLIVNGIKITSDKQKANVLADRLENVFSNDNNENFDKHSFDQIKNAINIMVLINFTRTAIKMSKNSHPGNSLLL